MKLQLKYGKLIFKGNFQFDFISKFTGNLYASEIHSYLAENLHQCINRILNKTRCGYDLNKTSNDVFWLGIFNRLTIFLKDENFTFF